MLRGRERETDEHRWTDRQWTDRQWTDGQTDRQMDRQRMRQRERERQRENACFSTFDLITMDRLMDQQTNRWTDGRMDKASYRFYD